MESIEAAPGLVDDLFDFHQDFVEQNLQYPEVQEHELEENLTENPQTVSQGLIDEEEEEELEWLSNEDAFPTLETFQEAPLQKPVQAPKRQSPVSVLEGSVRLGYVGFRVPVRPRSKRRRRRSLACFTVAESVGRRKCEHCGSENTPQWRAGPRGPKTLCNACGVRFKSGRLVPEYRPASSPTFSSDMHSNSHRKILEMRKKKHCGVRKDYGFSL